MNSHNRRTGLARTLVGAQVLGVVMTAALGLAPVQQAVADDHRGDERGDDRRQHDRGRGHQEHWQSRREPRYPVYIPPPVYYPRHESPGVTLVFPFELR